MPQQSERRNTPSVQVWNAFLAYLDEHPEAGKPMREFVLKGCNLQEIAWYVLHFVRGDGQELLEQNHARGRAIRRILADGIKGAKKAAEAYRNLVVHLGISEETVELVARAHRLDQEIADLEERLKRCDEAFGIKRFGVAGHWYWLVELQEYTRAVTDRELDPTTIAEFVKATRNALGWKHNGEDNNGRRYVNEELIRKALQKFRKRNPQYVHLLEDKFSHLRQK